MKNVQFRVSTMRSAIQLGLASMAVVGMMGQALAAEGNTRYIVHYKDGSHMGVKTALVGARANIKYQIQGMNAAAVEATPEGVKQLRADKNVVLVEEDVKRYPLNSSPSTGNPYLVGQAVPYGIAQVQADKLPDTNTANRKLCIIDSGYDRSHEDLSGNDVTGEYDSGTGWWYTDENSHGTHVAGTIAAINNSGVGVVGVNPNRKLKLHIVKVFGKDGWAYSSSLAAAANKCKAAGANIISMSLGGPSYSATENTTFSNLASAGILSIAAAGNDGNTAISYPAGYASVVSVGAIDQNKRWASFSQYNSKVELAGPGVSVLSTVPGSGSASSVKLIVGNVQYTPGTMTGSPKKNASAALADFGLGDRVNRAVAGKVCLIQRGTVDFATKVKNCESSGGVGAIVYNNVAGAFNGTLNSAVTNIPSVTASNADGLSMRSRLGQNAAISISSGSYASYDGTSMATPHVAGVAALVWSYFPTCTAAQIRTSLQKSALDLGTAGRDTRYGFGLVQAKTAHDRIKTYGCGK